MLKYLLFSLVLSSFVISDDCIESYESRGVSLDMTHEAFDCFENLSGLNKHKNSERLNKMAHLKFFEATYFNNKGLESLEMSYSLASESIKQYAPMFNSVEIKKLSSKEIDEVALSYYFYGTSVSKYVDLKGKWEAIKRMSEIKNSMTMILRLKKASTYHFGAYRNLAIFNLKVPKIAGGKISRSKLFFEKLLKESKNKINLSSYPVAHIYYAEYLRKIGQKEKACEQLALVANLTNEQIKANFNDLVFETIKDRELAVSEFEKFSCLK